MILTHNTAGSGLVYSSGSIKLQIMYDTLLYVENYANRIYVLKTNLPCCHSSHDARGSVISITIAFHASVQLTFTARV